MARLLPANDANTTKDADLALTIAHRCKEEKDSDAQIYWLNQARSFNKEHPFFTTQGNVSAFLKGIKSATINDLFNQGDSVNWLLDEIAACPTFKKLYFGTFFSPVCINKTFVNFLIKSEHVTELNMGSVWSADVPSRMTAEHAKILATGLRLNRSVEYLNVCDQRISDKGLIAIVDALVANPETKLTRLNLFCCEITDLGAQYLLEKLDNIPLLRDINLKYNNDCSKNMIATIEAKLIARKNVSPKLAETITAITSVSLTETGVASVVTNSMFLPKSKTTDKVAASTQDETLEDETKFKCN